MSIKLFKKNKLSIVGIMNGTSVDGADFVLCEVLKKGSNISIKYKTFEAIAFPDGLQSRLFAAVKHELKVEALSLLSHELGRFYAENLLKIKKSKKWKFDLVSFHGQTVFHKPPQATTQIGEAAYLAELFSVPVVSNFRINDLAVGGQGAPIASLFHKVAFFDKGASPLAVHNLGGISNLTLINKSGVVERAFDTGPANMLLDLAMQKFSNGKLNFDVDGKFASRGLFNVDLLNKLLADGYISKPPPKSCGREQYGNSCLDQFLSMAKKSKLVLSNEDLMATLVEFVAQSIAMNYSQFCKPLPKKIILCGGGAKNKFLVSRIKYHLGSISIETSAEHGWPVEAIEGGAFALLAAYRIWEIPNNIPKTTGAKKLVCMGSVTIP
jgi:anhydro-N-acetylmuramic acid kinase